VELLRAEGAAGVPVFAGGIIPDADIPTLQAAGIAAVFTPGASLEQGRPLLLEKAIRRFSGLNFVLAHWGWPWVWDATALALKYPNVFLDTSCLYYDSPKEFFQFVFSQQIPTTLIERTLRNQVVFGSNYPRVEIKNMVQALKSLPLTEDCLNKILRTEFEHDWKIFSHLPSDRLDDLSN
jgi:predicted TIM-barrel fold metal-dependent hydrolase